MSEVEKPVAHEDQRILDKLSNLPVMAAALDQLNSLYVKAKENRIVEATANATEAGIGMAFNITKPVVGKFEKQIDFLNKAACNQLDKLEESYPIIAKPTEEVVKATLEYGHQIVDPVVSKVTSIRDYGAEKVAGVTEQASKTLAFGGHVLSDATNFAVGVTLETANKVKDVVVTTGSSGVAKVTSAKNYGMEKVSEARQKVVDVVSLESVESVKNSVLETSSRFGNVLMSAADDKLVAYETCLNYYLPADGEGKEEELDEGACLVRKVISVSGKTRNRVTKKLRRELRSTLQKCGSLKEASMVQLENTKSYLFVLPEKLNSGVTYVRDSANDAASKASYEALSALNALVAAANGAKDKAEVVYKQVQEGGVNLSSDFEKLLASGKEFGLKFVHDVKDGSEKVVSYAIHLPSEKFESVKGKVCFLWTEINKPEEEVLKEALKDDGLPEASTLEKKLIVTSRHLLQRSKDVAAPVMGLVQVSKKQLEGAVDCIKNNLPELTTENVINTSYLQVSILKPDFSKIFSEVVSNSIGFLQKINTELLNLYNNSAVGNSDRGDVREVEEVERSNPVVDANHEEVKNIDDVTSEDEEEDDDEEEEEDDDINESSAQ